MYLQYLFAIILYLIVVSCTRQNKAALKMRTLSIVVSCCIVLLVAVAVASDNKPYYDLKDAPELFEKFIKDYNKHYASEADKEEHYKAFVESLQAINESNAKSDSATFDINQFADYTPEEMKKMRGYGGAFY